MHETAVWLHNVRSAHNVGSVFRTADAAGVSKIFLSGYTPTPIGRFDRPQKDIAKTALGAEVFIPWEYAKSSKQIFKKLKREDWHVVAVEQDKRAKDYRTLRALCPSEALREGGNKRMVFVFGNEVRGLSKSLRTACDEIVEIPMRGAMVRQAHHPRFTKRGKESLNVSVTAGIILFSCISKS